MNSQYHQLLVIHDWFDDVVHFEIDMFSAIQHTVAHRVCVYACHTLNNLIHSFNMCHTRTSCVSIEIFCSIVNVCVCDDDEFFHSSFVLVLRVLIVTRRLFLASHIEYMCRCRSVCVCAFASVCV